jgi:putative redox protein
MPLKKLSFKGSGGNRLSALLDLPLEGRPDAFALFAHCFTCTKNLKSINHISRSLVRSGIAVLRFDFTGLGESEGDFANTNFSSNIADLVAAADFLITNYEMPKILIGHSLGGAAVLKAATHIPSSRAVATIGAPAEPAHVLRHISDQKEMIEATGVLEVVVEGRPFKFQKQFIENLQQIEMEKTVRNLRKALLIFHSPVDTVVSIDNAAKIFQSARHPKSFISLDKADHLLMNETDAQYVGAMTAVWARRYLGSETIEDFGFKTKDQSGS